MKWDEFKKMMEKTKVRKKPRHIESDIQVACVSWFRMSYPQYLCFSVPNGGSRNAIEAANLKREGALAGVADMLVLIHGHILFVEMKTATGRQSEHQKNFEGKVRSLGFDYVICRSLKEFILTVEKWIKNIEQYGGINDVIASE